MLGRSFGSISVKATQAVGENPIFGASLTATIPAARTDRLKEGRLFRKTQERPAPGSLFLLFRIYLIHYFARCCGRSPGASFLLHALLRTESPSARPYAASFPKMPWCTLVSWRTASGLRDTSARRVKRWSVSFSSLRFCSSRLATLARPNCSAQLHNVP